MRRALISMAAAAVLAGCGNDPTPGGDVGLIRAPSSFRDAGYPKQGVFFRAPANWAVVPGEAPQVAVITAGDAQIAIWRYPRTEPLPETRSQLHAARQALVAEVQSRDPTFRLSSSRLVIKARLRAVELIGTGTNQGVRRRVRSLHAYGQKAEVVLDAFAPPQDFARVDEQTFGPLARSLKLRRPRP